MSTDVWVSHPPAGVIMDMAKWDRKSTWEALAAKMQKRKVVLA